MGALSSGATDVYAWPHGPGHTAPSVPISLVRVRARLVRLTPTAPGAAGGVHRYLSTIRHVPQGNIITLCPPLTVTTDEMAHAFDILEECIAEAADRASASA